MSGHTHSPICPNTSTYTTSRACSSDWSCFSRYLTLTHYWLEGASPYASPSSSALSPASDLCLPPHVPRVTHVRARRTLYLLLSAITSSLDAEQQPQSVQKGIALPEPLCQSTPSHGFLGLRQESSVPLISRQDAHISYAALTLLRHGRYSEFCRGPHSC